VKTILFFISSSRYACRDRLEGICRYARTRDWHVQAVEWTTGRASVKETLRFWKPEGVIVECGNPLKGLNRRLFGNLPVVWFDAKPGSRGSGSYMGFDSTEAGRLAARKLTELGYEHFAYVGPRMRRHWSDERHQAFDAELAASGKCRALAFSRSEGQTQVVECKNLIGWLRALPRPCGIFVANDITATQVLAACEKGGIAVPGDVSVISVDNDESICENVRPTLSSIAPDFVHGGYLAARLLNELILNGVRAQRMETFGVVKTVLRESTRSLVGGTAHGSVVNRIKDRVRRLGAVGASVGDVVEGLGCTRRLAELRFRETTGKTILEAINDAVFERACELIRSGVKPSVLAGVVGNVSRSTLERIFRVRAGVSSAEWSKRYFAK